LDAPSTLAARPSVRSRVAVVLLVSLAAAAVVVFSGRTGRTRSTDFDQLWVGARMLLQGRNPYELIGPGREFPWPFPLVFPLPAVVAAVPFAGLSLEAARVLFATLGAAAFGWAVTKRSLVPALLCLSIPFLAAVRLGQWSTLLAAAMLIPWLGVTIAAKPSIGLSVLAAAETSRRLVILVASALALVVVSFIVRPGWTADWATAVASVPNYRPYVLRPGGVLLLLALARWRRPEARVLVAIACLPSTPGAYDALIALAALFAFIDHPPRRTVLLLALLSDATLPVTTATPGVHASFTEYLRDLSTVNLACIYLPALIVILRRPNEGQVPRWLEWALEPASRRVARLGAWIRPSSS